MQSTLILVDDVFADTSTKAGTRLSLPARIDGRVGRLVVSVECFEAAPPPARRRRTRLLTAEELSYVRVAMCERVADSIRRKDLAALIGMSVSDFSRAFHASAGMTFAAYLLQLRLDRAKELMRTTRHTLYEIAVASGFGDQSNFSRRFTREAGQPPSKWLAMHRPIS